MSSEAQTIISEAPVAAPETKSMTIIVTKGSLDWAYPPFILATTAAAMAVARRWPKLVLPAILCGTLGYAIGTFVGVAVGRALGA